MDESLTAEILSTLELDSRVSEPHAIDLYDAGTELTQAAKEADERGDHTQALAYRLLNTICHLHFRPDERAEPYGPMATFANGLRTAAGSDFTREQCEALFANLDRFKTVLLKGRIADLTWLNNRSNAGAGRKAIEYFVELANQATAGEATAKYIDLSPGDHLTVGLLNRAIAIAFAIGWDGQEPSDLRDAIVALYGASKNNAGPGFSRAAELSLRSGAIEPSVIFEDAMTIGKNALDHKRLDDAEWAYACAVNAATKTRDHEKERSSKLALSQTFEAKADSAPAGFMRVHALEQAIDTLRGLRERERRRSLHLKLSDAQIDVQDDFGVFEHQMDLTDIVESTRNGFGSLGLDDAIRQFALLAIPKKREELVEQAREMGSEFPLSGLFPTVIVDEKGRTIAKEGMTEIGEASRHLLLRNLSVDITVTVGGQIEPAREIIYSEKGLTEAYVIALCRHSPFVPKHAAVMLGEGFFAFFQREYAKAGCFCLPYLEACLRHVLDQAGEPTTVIKSEGVESNIALSTILTRYREQIDRILPEEYVFAIENLFDHPLGEKIRHRFAHGLLSRGHFFSHSMIYCLWLMFSLTVLPLLKPWDEVTKVIKAELC